jgi:hypothetical protein
MEIGQTRRQHRRPRLHGAPSYPRDAVRKPRSESSASDIYQSAGCPRTRRQNALACSLRTATTPSLGGGEHAAERRFLGLVNRGGIRHRRRFHSIHNFSGVKHLRALAPGHKCGRRGGPARIAAHRLPVHKGGDLGIAHALRHHLTADLGSMPLRNWPCHPSDALSGEPSARFIPHRRVPMPDESPLVGRCRTAHAVLIWVALPPHPYRF